MTLTQGFEGQPLHRWVGSEQSGPPKCMGPGRMPTSDSRHTQSAHANALTAQAGWEQALTHIQTTRTHCTPTARMVTDAPVDADRHTPPAAPGSGTASGISSRAGVARQPPKWVVLPAGLRALHMAGSHVCSPQTLGGLPHYKNSQRDREACSPVEAPRRGQRSEGQDWEVGQADS